MSAYDYRQMQQRFDDAVARMVAELSTHLPRLSATTGISANEAFPFRYYASFRKETGSPDEDAVISIDIRRTDTGFACESDIASGIGHVWLEGPTATVSSPLPSSEALDTWAKEVIAFIGSSIADVRERLRQS